MSREHKKYLREQTALRDNRQIQINSLKPMTNPLAELQIDFNANISCMCPFCLHLGIIRDFSLRTKHGLHHGLGECPECKNKAEWRTLTAMPNWSPEEYATWVFNSRHYNFWQKANFDVWRKRLKYDREQYNRFWKRYYDLRGDYESEEEYH